MLPFVSTSPAAQGAAEQNHGLKLGHISKSTIWTQQNAESAGKCAISGEDISIGDPIYVTADPAFATWRILVTAYNEYEIQKRASVQHVERKMND